MMATRGDWRSTPGSSSMAAAANTTPAAKCCRALVSRGPGERMAATPPESAAAATGTAVTANATPSTGRLSLPRAATAPGRAAG